MTETKQVYLFEHKNCDDKADVLRFAAFFLVVVGEPVTIKQDFETKYLKLSMKYVHTYV